MRQEGRERDKERERKGGKETKRERQEGRERVKAVENNEMKDKENSRNCDDDEVY
ncbi:TRAF3-interacting protein 1-like [Periplaneta americana]|uniref:TRAF3-interacting protein 1-like n=1 Tax=Periplaneta americana TaxID=6978 RepID=UPI0037E8E87F